MGISINISSDQEATLRQVWGDGLNQATIEALAVEGYRNEKFGSATVRRLLGHQSRYETEAWLAERGISLNYSLDDLEADRKTLERLFSENT